MMAAAHRPRPTNPSLQLDFLAQPIRSSTLPECSATPSVAEDSGELLARPDHAVGSGHQLMNVGLGETTLKRLADGILPDFPGSGEE